MELSQILNALSDEGQEKTASENPTEGGSAAEGGLSAALDSALAATSVEKTASVASSGPENDLTKIASRLATAEQEALVKEAELYGAALCDGFMSRMGQYESHTGFGKTASANTVTDASFTKFASENPALVKQAMELGYRETKAQLEKVAESAYHEGYEKTAAAIKVAAEDCAQAGFNHATKVLATL